MKGALHIVGLGPGPQRWVTPAVTQLVTEAEALVGYDHYLDRLPPRAGQQRYGSGNRVEAERARQALALAGDGLRVALVSGGDPGVFAMAAAVFEEIDRGHCPFWQDLDITIEPGITAMLAAAAQVGAPLGADFCALSLSDNLKSWAVIEQRLAAVLAAGLVVALYNPVSKARPDGLARALSLAGAYLAPGTPVIFARAVGRDDQSIITLPLELAKDGAADMATLVILGSQATRMLERGDGKPPLVYTPRRVVAA